MHPTLADTINTITDEIAFCHEQIRYFDSLADLEGKKVMERIKELKVAKSRLQRLHQQAGQLEIII